MVLTVTEGSCWLVVRENNESGQDLYAGTLSAGGQQSFTTAKRYWVRAGAPEALSISVNGTVHTVTGEAGTFLITEQGVEREEIRFDRDDRVAWGSAPPVERGSTSTLSGAPRTKPTAARLPGRSPRRALCFVDEPEAATHILLNTCGFIREAKEESIAAILDATGSVSRQEGPGDGVPGGAVPRRTGNRASRRSRDGSAWSAGPTRARW